MKDQPEPDNNRAILGSLVKLHDLGDNGTPARTPCLPRILPEAILRDESFVSGLPSGRRFLTAPITLAEAVISPAAR
jgi:hypothetical protein